MLVLSRKLGNGVVIDNRFVVTVAVLAHEFVELSLSDPNGTVAGTVTLGKTGLTPIMDRVRAVFIRTEGDKARLGFDGPPGCRIDRSESWIPPPR